MRVRFTTPVDLFVQLHYGDVVELPDEVVLRYLNCGAAERVVPVEEADRAVVAAAMQPPQKRTHGKGG